MKLVDISEENKAIASKGLKWVNERLYEDAQGDRFYVKDLYTYMATTHYYGQRYGIHLTEYMRAKNNFAELAPPNDFEDRLERIVFEKISPSKWLNPNVKYDYEKEENPRYTQFWNFILHHTQLGKYSSELAILATLAHVSFYEYLRERGIYHPKNIFLPVKKGKELTILSICPYFQYPEYGASGSSKAEIGLLFEILPHYVPQEEIIFPKDYIYDTDTRRYYLSDLHIFKRYPCHIVLEWYSDKIGGETARKIRKHIRKSLP